VVNVRPNYGKIGEKKNPVCRRGRRLSGGADRDAKGRISLMEHQRPQAELLKAK